MSPSEEPFITFFFWCHFHPIIRTFSPSTLGFSLGMPVLHDHSNVFSMTFFLISRWHFPSKLILPGEGRCRMAVNWRGVRVVESSREGALTMENVIPCPSFFLYSERLAPLHVGKISLAVNLKFKTTRSPTTVSIFSMDNRGKFLC